MSAWLTFFNKNKGEIDEMFYSFFSDMFLKIEEDLKRTESDYEKIYLKLSEFRLNNGEKSKFIKILTELKEYLSIEINNTGNFLMEIRKLEINFNKDLDSRIETFFASICNSINSSNQMNFCEKRLMLYKKEISNKYKLIMNEITFYLKNSSSFYAKLIIEEINVLSSIFLPEYLNFVFVSDTIEADINTINSLIYYLENYNTSNNAIGFDNETTANKSVDISKKIKIFTSRELKILAEKEGFVSKWFNGSHEIFKHRKTNKLLVIPTHNIGKGLSYEIQKQIKENSR